jgi:hypothetical protein
MNSLFVNLLDPFLQNSTASKRNAVNAEWFTRKSRFRALTKPNELFENANVRFN